MLDHHVQRSIVYHLALAPSLRFSELKPDTIESKLFTYHLKKVVSAGLVHKTEDGQYELTPDGRLLGVHVLENTMALADRAYSVLFLVVRRKSDGAWLVYKRKTHPLIGKVGFMHSTPNALGTSVQTAARECKEKTGLDCEFSVRGGGFFRVFEGGELESFTNFTLLVCEDAVGELHEHDEYAEYYWTDAIDTNDKDALPNMALLMEQYNTGEQFFVERTLNV